MQPYNPDQVPYHPTDFNQMPPMQQPRKRRGWLIIGILTLALVVSLLLCTGVMSVFVDANTPAHSIEQPVIRLHKHT